MTIFSSAEEYSQVTVFTYTLHYVRGKIASGFQNTARALTAMGDFPSSLSRSIVYRTRAHSFVSQIDRVVSNLKV